MAVGLHHAHQHRPRPLIDPLGSSRMNPTVEAVTNMATPAFTKTNTREAARRHVSAMLVGGCRTYPDVRVLGVLHPEALRPLPATALRGTSLYSWQRWPPAHEGELAWTDERAP